MGDIFRPRVGTRPMKGAAHVTSHRTHRTKLHNHSGARMMSDPSDHSRGMRELHEMLIQLEFRPGRQEP